MAVRAFRDRGGVQWTVWAVEPPYAERRSATDRRSGVDRRGPGPHVPPDVERRSGVERRKVSHRRNTPIPGYELGWLCFEGGGQRRRLSPIPADWERCSCEALDRYRIDAAVTRPPTRPTT